jgi:hypothetical protein
MMNLNDELENLYGRDNLVYANPAGQSLKHLEEELRNIDSKALESQETRWAMVLEQLRFDEKDL